MKRNLQILRRRFYTFLYHRLYHELAPLYDLVSWVVSLGQWDRWRRSALGFVQGERVLEIGFGTGELLYLLAIKAKQTVGLDASAAMHRITAAKLRQRHTRVPRIQGRAQQLPFASESFDCVVMTFPAEFVMDPHTAQEVERILRPGGRWITVDAHMATERPLLRWLLRIPFPAHPQTAPRSRSKIKEGRFHVTHHFVGTGAMCAVVTVAEKPS